ncbi:hypothetical protein MKX03_019650 [Papaver bracteatum]|nr:hypothetical protein MKX03_019650 [Papaver bracteatum]
MFFAGDDKQVKCWDLEQNNVIRSYHGNLSGVYCLSLHPTIDVWDICTKMQAFALSGHDNTVCSVFTRPTVRTELVLDHNLLSFCHPQVVTGSHELTYALSSILNKNWKTMVTLTHHKKFVRAMALHPTKHSFASASADNINKFGLPKGDSQHKTIINAMVVNEDGVMDTGGICCIAYLMDMVLMVNYIWNGGG